MCADPIFDTHTSDNSFCFMYSFLFLSDIYIYKYKKAHHTNDYGCVRNTRDENSNLAKSARFKSVHF